MNNTRITNRKIIENEFNYYFTSIASELNKNLSDMNIENSKILSQSVPNSIYLSDELDKIVSAFSNGNASVQIIKKCSSVIIIFLTQ